MALKSLSLSDLKKKDDRRSAKTGPTVEEIATKDIAIIGVAAHLPAAGSLEEFWTNIREGRDCVGPFPESRSGDIDRYLRYSGKIEGKAEYLEGAYLDEIDKFDYSMFRLTPKEAGYMNPSQRLFLQSAWQVIEDAGYGGRRLSGSKTGVYVGYMGDIEGYHYKQMISDVEGTLNPMAVAGNFPSIIPSRISYLLDLRGPTMVIDTSCSSSLVAVHLAVQAIRNGDCDMAIAGGVHLSMMPVVDQAKVGMESDDARARTFDDSSEGTGQGEGVATVLLKPLHQALRDGDRVYGVVKGTAINQDGASIGITAPNVKAQTDVLIKAWQDAEINPESLSYYEAHGTGTTLGDPIEIEGISEAFSRFTEKKQFCAIGSLKTNIGHLFEAAGIAGLVKVLMAMKHRELPPNVHFNRPNRKIPFTESPVYVSDRLQAWDTDGAPRRAGISAFGFSGTNCHIVLEEAPVRPAAETTEAGPLVFTLSGRNAEALKSLLHVYQTEYAGKTAAELRDVCFTQNTGRGHYTHRLALVLGEGESFGEKLALAASVLDSAPYEDAGIYVQAHRIVPSDKTDRVQGEVTEEELSRWNEQAAQLLSDYVRTQDAGLLSEVCGLYAAGADVLWELLYQKEKRKRVPVPLYPLARERCWVNVPDVQGRVVERGGAAAKQGQIEVRLSGKLEAEYTQTEREIAAVWGEVLGFREINVYDSLFELGADSISMMRVAQQVSEALNADVTLHRLTQFPSVTKLAEYVASGVSQARQITYPPAILDPASLHEPFSLTDVQMAYLMGRDVTYELGGVSTHIYFEYETELDIPRLSQSLQRVIDRHPMLRAVFLPSGEQQILTTMPRYEIETDDVLSEGAEAVDRKIEEVRGRMSHHMFDAEQWPLFEFRAVKTSANTHRLFVSVDMLISDGASYDRIAREMLAYYHNPELELPKLDITFRDYMVSFMEFRRSETYLRDREYWVSQLPTFPSAPALPMIASPAEVGVPTFTRLNKMYPKEVWERVRARARRYNVTPSALLATAYASVLAYWSNQSRLAINLTVFNRFPFHEQIDQLVGDFTSIMLLSVDFDPAAMFEERALHVQDRLMEALEHRHYDGIELIREYARYHGLGQQAAMPVVFTSMLQGDGWNSWADIGELKLGVSQTPQVVLDHQAIEVQGDLMLNWDYVDTLFDSELINKMFDHYTGMLEAWMADEEAELPSLPEPDRAYVEAYNDTAEEIPTETLHGLFSAQVARTPEWEAVRFGDESLTYAELDRRSNQVARYLLERGVGRNDLIGVFGKRHPSTIVSILGILKAGAAYVPVDPDYPEDRVQYILSNSSCKVFLGDGAYDTEGIAKYSADALDVPHHPEDLAYIIYTSGSTGRPKGVVITHQAAANTVQDMNRKFSVGPEDRILGISSLCFDLSVYDIFGALAAGAALVQIADQRDVRDMIDIVVRERITVWNSVPAILDLTVDTLDKGFANTDLRVVLLSGDKIPLPLPDKVKQHFTAASVISLGGATEASIWSIYYPIEEVRSNWKTIPYGMPLANQTFYVLNPQLELCPVGVQGELYIGGVGLAQGYFNDEEKTRAAFFTHPTFGPLYKTGDHGVWRPEGHIEFLGRIDHQVKIRGYRVELGEIETTLMHHPSVKNATVIDRTDASGKKYLCAYIVPESDAEIVSADMREHLGETLPDYMVPSYFVTIEAIPLTPNGKVDRKALPEPEIKASDLATDREPRTETEAVLQRICQDVLGMPHVSVVANFFELGLNSVLMVQMINRIGREMNVKISFRDFVRQNNIEQLAVFVGKDGGASEAAPVAYASYQPDPANIGEEFPLTDIQMAYLLGRDPNFELGGISNHAYGEILTDLDMKRFQEALNAMIKRHPMLRAIILPHGMQKILPEVPEYEVVVEDLRHLSEEARTARLWDERNRMSHYMFPTDQWPLFEFKSFRVSDDSHMLLFGYDMLIIDQASMDIFARELMKAYRGDHLPELDFTFRDYMIAYEEFKSSETYLRDREFWLNKLETFPSAPILPLKEDPMKVKNPHFHKLEYVFTKAQWAELKRKANQRNITPSALLATAYATVLAHWSNQPQLALNLTVFNRYPFHDDVPSILGDFTSVMLVDVDLKPERTLWEEASELQATMMDALEHRHYDGVEFIREFSRQHSLGTKAAMPFIFTSALFGDQNQAGTGLTEMGEVVTLMNQTSQLYIDHQVFETLDNKLAVKWFYVHQLFEERVIETMFEQYIGSVLALIEGKDCYQFDLTDSDALVIERYNRTEEPIRQATLHELFVEQAARVPDGVAVKLGDQSYTYRELDLRSNQIAHALRAAGVERGDGIGVLAKRVPETIANMLGILKAGAAYVPVDPAYPEDRQTYILENSACKLFLQPDYYDLHAKSQSDASLTGNNHPEDVAYVIYTSGSTGRPKGVVIAHHAAANTIQDINHKFEVNENDRIIGVSSMCFDLSVYDIFGALSTGATLVMVPNQRDVDNILHVIQNEQITFWNSAPPIMDMVVEGLAHREDLFLNQSLRAVLLSGDWIPLTLPEKVLVYFPNSEIVSLGGATEVSIWSIYYPVDEVQPGWASIPYGRPLANQTFHVLNYRQEPCPVGVLGELYIGGVGLAEGYHNDLEKTNAAFIDHPELGRLYRTGDYGILHPRAYIEFMGRKDSQVKIRGYRVELNEINSNLVKHPALSNAIVIDRTDANKKKYLCAYYVPEPGVEVSVDELRETLEKDLPEYMVPSYFVRLDAIPLTPNGKVDRKGLPEPDLSEGSAKHVEPQTELELQLAAVWQEVLEMERVGTQDDFFDIGGNSLLMVRVKGQLDKLFPDRLSFMDLFTYTTIEQLAAFLEG